MHMETFLHDCHETLSQVTQACHDLLDLPLLNSELTWFMDGSSFVKTGIQMAGATVVDHNGEVVWSHALPLRSSMRKAELIALPEAHIQVGGYK